MFTYVKTHALLLLIRSTVIEAITEHSEISHITESHADILAHKLGRLLASLY